MKLRNKFVATLSATTLAMVGWAVPVAVATEDAVPSTAQNCKDMYTQGSDGWSDQINTTGEPGSVTIDAAPGMLIDKVCVKAGSQQSGGGPETIEYDPGKTSVTFSHSTTKAVSNYMYHQVPEPQPDFPVPACTSITVTWAASIEGQTRDINVRLVNTDPQHEDYEDSVTLNFHEGNSNYSGSWAFPTETFDYTKHDSFPADWNAYNVVWVQIHGFDTHWGEAGYGYDVVCGEIDPEPEYVCVWDAQSDTSTMVAASDEYPNAPTWTEGIDCGPGEQTYCFQDGNGGYTQMTVRDDGVYELGEPVDSALCDDVVICPNFGGVDEQGQPLTSVPEGWSVKDNGDCYYEVYDCWLLPTTVPLGTKILSGQTLGGRDYDEVPQNGPLAFPQIHLGWSENLEDLIADNCGYVPECEEVRWLQTDLYQVGSAELEDLLAQLREDGLTWSAERGGALDGDLWKGHGFIKVTGDDCAPVYEDYCVWDSDTNTASQQQLEVGAEVPDGWVPWNEQTGLAECTPPQTPICEQGEQGWTGVWYFDEDLPDTYTPWTGDPLDCITTDGTIEFCHATGDLEGNPFTTASVSWSALADEYMFDGEDFETGHGIHEGDIIPPFEVKNASGDVLYAFEGQNTQLLFLIEDFGCETFDAFASATSTVGACDDPAGSFSYDVTVGTQSATTEFRLMQGDTVLETYGPFAAGSVEEITDDGLAPGDYRIEGYDPLFPVANLLYTQEFTVDTPADCTDLAPTFLGGVCDANAPYLQFSIVLDDPYGDLDGTFPRPAQVDFVNAETATGNALIDLELRTDASYTVDGVQYAYSASGTTHTWTGAVLWPGAGVDAEGNATDWPGWQTNADGSYTNVGLDNFGWTRGGVDITVSVNPSVTVEGVTYPPATPDCDGGPPPVDVCEYTDNGAQMVTYYGVAPEGSIPWVDGSECTPIVICTLDGDMYYPLEIMLSDLQETDILWNDEAEFEGGCRDPQPATLTGSVLNSVCVADSPWLQYSITIHNPDDQPLEGFEPGDEILATITFTNPDGEDHVIENVPVAEMGYILWPGAAVAPAEGLTEADIVPGDASTFVATGWPGWYQDELGQWFEYEDSQENFGWTRGDVTVTIAVNPETTLTVNYPPPTPTCAAAPPEEFTNVAGVPPLPEARPAVPVEAVATYAG